MSSRQGELIPSGEQPVQAVKDPIINSPYEEPQKHWVYIGSTPHENPTRRPASYWYKTKRTGRAEGQGDLLREESRDDLPLVNALREDVGRWRDSGYRGATHVTRELLNHWIAEDRPRRLFFCQREAVETIIYLLELAISGRLSSTRFQNFKVGSSDIERLLNGEKPGFAEFEAADFFPRLVDLPAEDSLIPLRRLGCKMATGAGKTVVMAMLIAWAFCNRGRNPNSRQFPNAVLVCAPNLTVRSRLQVLRPEMADNYYDKFDIVPPRYREFLNTGKVLITNWHKFAPKSEHNEGGASFRVVNKGEETDDAFTLDRLGDLAERVPILVLNDEGHHCWRPKPAVTDQDIREAERELSAEEKAALREDAEEARVWLAGLDRINNSGLLGKDSSGQLLPSILTCVDLSATPFYLSNSGYPEGSPFPWLVSDFGLVDAIECGITKVPRLPVADDTGQKDEAGRPDPKYFRLWRNIQDSCSKSEKVRGTPKADAVYKYAQDALLTLASQWKVQFEKARDDSAGQHFIPPVLIVVCDNTEISQVMYEKIAGEKEVEMPDPDKPGKTKKETQYGGGEVFPELLENSKGIQRTIRIDSKLVDKDDSIRAIVDTVGVRGGLGEQIRCVVSVSMLTEGWDANNVTHILGIRAFGSQLLCEQVVGRGLRRMSYTPDPETGLLPAEYADVYGIPFSLIPFKGKPKEPNGGDPTYSAIYALEQRAHYEIRMPNVEGYVYELKDHGIRCDVESLEPMNIDKTPGEVWLEPTRGYRDESEALPTTDGLVKHTREAYYDTVRPQQIVFMLAQRVLDQLLTGAQAEDDRRKAELRLRARHQLFPEIVSIVQRYVASKVRLKEGLDIRELGLQVYAQELVNRLCDNILPAAAEKGKLIPILNRFRPYNTTADVNYQTTRPVENLSRSHLNRAMIQSNLERQAIDVLEDLDCVECYTPNDTRVGLVVPYEYNEEPKSYEPDFVVKLYGGKTLMLEIKGGKGKIHDENRVFAKNAAAKKWCTAVSNLGRYGDWVFEIWDDDKESVTDLRKKIAQHGLATSSLPFRFVAGSESRLWENCVPLVTLRSLATKSDRQTKLAGGAWDHELITWDKHPAFEAGMFVARVDGASMEPLIPAGTYCLFRKASEADLAERVLLVSHPKINDAEYGGNWTIRKVSVTGSVGEGSGADHGQVKLTAAMPGDLPVTIDLSGAESLSVLGEFVGTLPTEGSFEREAEV